MQNLGRMPRFRRFVALALACLAIAATPARAQTAGLPLVVAEAYRYFPGDAHNTSLDLVVARNQTLKFLNVDPVGGFHTITAEDVDRQGTPIFDSGLQPVAPGSLVDVLGTAALAAGTYYFYCAVHGALAMEGKLTVV